MKGADRSIAVSGRAVARDQRVPVDRRGHGGLAQRAQNHREAMQTAMERRSRLCIGSRHVMACSLMIAV